MNNFSGESWVWAGWSGDPQWHAKQPFSLFSLLRRDDAAAVLNADFP